jgi:hypothetical protein
MHSHRALFAMLFLVAACDGGGAGARAPVELDKVKASVSAPMPASASAARSAPPVASTAAPPPPAPPPLDEYSDCKERVRAISDGPLDAAALARASSADLVWPPLCGEVSGWAGISMIRSTEAAAFGRASDRFVVCGFTDACDVVDLSTGKPAKRVVPSRPNGIDGSPVTSTPEVAALFRQLGAPAAPGPFGYSDELRVSWKLGDQGQTLDVTLVSIKTGDEIVLHHFPTDVSSSEQPIVLEKAVLSPDGGVLELDTFTGQGGTGFDVALVNLDAAAARLFGSMAAGSKSSPYTEKAASASRLAKRHAHAFSL